jgi:hypothetical protein
VLGVAYFGAVPNTQYFAGVAQPLDFAGTQIPIVDGISGRIHGVADRVKICALGFHALPEQS